MPRRLNRGTRANVREFFPSRFPSASLSQLASVDFHCLHNLSIHERPVHVVSHACGSVPHLFGLRGGRDSVSERVGVTGRLEAVECRAFGQFQFLTNPSPGVLKLSLSYARLT